MPASAARCHFKSSAPSVLVVEVEEVVVVEVVVEAAVVEVAVVVAVPPQFPSRRLSCC